MKMRSLLTLLSILASTAMMAQQIPQFSQYLLNDYAVNPAVAGARDAIEIRSNNRLQWVGIKDAPRTYTLSLTNPISEGKMGVGAYIFTDIVGPTRRIGVQGSYAYHWKIDENFTIGTALSVGLTEYTLDGDKINLENNDDPSRINTLGRSRIFDSKAGLYARSDKFFFGFAIPQLIQSELQLYNGVESVSRIESHYLAYAGYRFDLNEDFILEPSGLYKSIVPTPAAIDISLRAFYQERIWLGASMRLNDAFVAMLGYKWEDRLVFGYSYDFSANGLNGYAGGTHELMIGIDLGKSAN